ncbi:MAG: hypothetical protein ACK56F_02360, partial [bacterium]
MHEVVVGAARLGPHLQLGRRPSQRPVTVLDHAGGLPVARVIRRVQHQQRSPPSGAPVPPAMPAAQPPDRSAAGEELPIADRTDRHPPARPQ